MKSARYHDFTHVDRVNSTNNTRLQKRLFPTHVVWCSGTWPETHVRRKHDVTRITIRRVEWASGWLSTCRDTIILRRVNDDGSRKKIIKTRRRRRLLRPLPTRGRCLANSRVVSDPVSIGGECTILSMSYHTDAWSSDAWCRCAGKATKRDVRSVSVFTERDRIVKYLHRLSAFKAILGLLEI